MEAGIALGGTPRANSSQINCTTHISHLAPPLWPFNHTFFNIRGLLSSLIVELNCSNIAFWLSASFEMTASSAFSSCSLSYDIAMQ